MTRFLPGLLLLVFVLGCSKAPSGDNKGPASAASGDDTGVILLRYNPGSESTEQRERGFLETLEKEYPDIRILSSNEYSGTRPETALDKSQTLLLKFGDQVTGVFAVCEPNATGMLGALEEAGLAGKVKFIGFDPTPRMVQAMRDGTMHGIVLQDPVQMGYQAVKAIVEHLDGKQVEKRVSTGEYMATPENMDTKRMAQLLDPEEFSGEEAAPEKAKYRIAVIPKGTTHLFWKSVHAGAENAAKELGNVDVLWKGPLEENDREGQINVVQDFVTSKVDGICLAPLDSRGLEAVVKEAKDENIPTVIFDSGLDDESLVVSYVATDNYQGGVLAARRLAETLGVKPAATPAKSKRD